jgi:hypothetical protein
MWLITLSSHKDKTLIHCLKFWIPKPPSAFGVQMSFQALKQSPFEFVSSLISFHTKNTNDSHEFSNELVGEIFDM